MTKTKEELEEMEQELFSQYESDMVDNIEQYDWLIEHTIENQDEVLNNFIRNYRPHHVHQIIQFGGYESDEAKSIITKLGPKATYDLILKHLYIKQDHDLYHEHWNDIGSCDWSEYEVQIDLDSDNPDHQELLKVHPDGYIHGYISLGKVRYKLDAEAFESALLKLHNIDVSELDDESEETA